MQPKITKFTELVSIHIQMVLVLPRISKKHIRIQQNPYLRIIGILGYYTPDYRINPLNMVCILVGLFVCKDPNYPTLIRSEFHKDNEPTALKLWVELRVFNLLLALWLIWPAKVIWLVPKNQQKISCSQRLHMFCYGIRPQLHKLS